MTSQWDAIKQILCLFSAFCYFCHFILPAIILAASNISQYPAKFLRAKKLSMWLWASHNHSPILPHARTWGFMVTNEKCIITSCATAEDQAGWKSKYVRKMFTYLLNWCLSPYGPIQIFARYSPYFSKLRRNPKLEPFWEICIRNDQWIQHSWEGWMPKGYQICK